MENLKKFETEEQYLIIKDTIEYPQVSYTEDNEKVWVKEKPISYIVAKYNVSEENINQNIPLFANGYYDFHFMVNYYVVDDGTTVYNTYDAIKGINEYHKFTTSGEHTVTFYIDINKMIETDTNVDYKETIDLNYAFDTIDNLISIDFTHFKDSSLISKVNRMFSYCFSLTSITFGDKWDSSNITDITHTIACLDANVIKDFDNFYKTLNITNDNGEKLSENETLDLMRECMPA